MNMRSVSVGLGAAALLASAAHAQFFVNGRVDPVVLRVGQGTATTSGTGYTVQLQHYYTGVANQAGPVSTTTFASGASGTNRAVLSASATSEGTLTNSIDTNYVVFAGYNAASGTAAVNGATANADRVIGYGAVSPGGLSGVGVTSTIGTQAAAYNANNIRSATSRSGPTSDAWSAGTGATSSTAGVRYANTNTQVSSTITNIRSVDVYNGQLYCSSSTGAFLGVSMVGGVLPTGSGNTITSVTSQASSSCYEFCFTNTGGAGPLDPTTGFRTCYVADDRTTALGGIQRWDWSGSAWTVSYNLQLGTGTGSTLTLGARGLAGCYDGTNNILYATNNTGTGLYQITDLGPSSTALLLASAGTNNVFRGVALVPTPGAGVLVGLGLLASNRRRRA